jgi:tRNA(fMet)-specific endonuclease VapC
VTSSGESAWVVVDADVASFVVKDDPIRKPRYLVHLQGRGVVVPFSVLAELRYGAEVRNWGADRCARVDEFVADARVHYADDRLCTVWAQVRASARRAGREIAPQDAWVAAVAVFLDIPLVTHNARHYEGLPDLEVVTSPDARPAGQP